MYATGSGVPQDFVLAHMWYNQAGASGLELAIENRDRLAADMTMAQVAEAQQLAREQLGHQLKIAQEDISPLEQQTAVTGIESITTAAPPAAGIVSGVRSKKLPYGPRHHGFKRRR
jgi:TPR repeat protein